MKNRYRLCTMALLIIISSIAFAQIPNPGFENWAGDTLAGWGTTNAPPVYTNVTQTRDVHTGSYAVRGEVVNLYFRNISAAIQSGPGGKGFAVNQKYTGITGYYKFTSAGGDKLGLNFWLLDTPIVENVDSTHWVAYGIQLLGPAAEYTKFTVPFTYLKSTTPVWSDLQIMIVGPSNGPDVHLGSFFQVDDLAFEGGATAVGYEGDVPSDFGLSQNYPNPFNPTTNIRFRLPEAGNVNIAVFDLLGREVSVLANGFYPAGTFHTTFDGADVASGTYIVRMTATGAKSVSTQYIKMQLIK